MDYRKVILLLCALVLASLSKISYAYDVGAPGLHKAPNAFPFDWKQFGKQIIDNAPQDIKNGTTRQKAQYIYHKVGIELTKQKVYPNTSLLWKDGRIWQLGTDGTCGDVSKKLGQAFDGAGMSNMMLTAERDWKGMIKNMDFVNMNHGANAVFIDGKVYMFDLWAAGRDNFSFDRAGDSPWNGMPLEEWEKIFKAEGYVSFTRDQVNKYKNAIDAFQNEIQAWENQKRLKTLDKAIERVEKEHKIQTNTMEMKKDDVVDMIKKNEPNVWNCIKGDYEWYMKAVQGLKDVDKLDKWVGSGGTVTYRKTSWFNCGVGASWQMWADKQCCDEFYKNKGKPGAWDALQKCGWEYEIKSRKESLDKTMENCRKKYSNKK